MFIWLIGCLKPMQVNSWGHLHGDDSEKIYMIGNKNPYSYNFTQVWVLLLPDYIHNKYEKI